MLGLVLAGGLSQRMGQDKSQMIYPEISDRPQRERLLVDLKACGLKSFISCRPDQILNKEIAPHIILDRPEFIGGPGVGLLSAHLQFPDSAWLVVACDFPWLGQTEIKELISERRLDGKSVATQHLDETVEPLFAIWEPEALRLFLAEFRKGFKSPQKILQQSKCAVIKMKNMKALTNINTKQEVEAHHELRPQVLKKNLN